MTSVASFEDRGLSCGARETWNYSNRFSAEADLDYGRICLHFYVSRKMTEILLGGCKISAGFCGCKLEPDSSSNYQYNFCLELGVFNPFKPILHPHPVTSS